MKKMLITLLKSMFSEKVLKAIVIALGDYLVLKSTNKLDDKLWDKVKDKLAV
tara:strand:- start:3508 stop:3663 length:156 start_codon:yes stop_codon:yes gene_type:complete